MYFLVNVGNYMEINNISGPDIIVNTITKDMVVENEDVYEDNTETTSTKIQSKNQINESVGNYIDRYA